MNASEAEVRVGRTPDHPQARPDLSCLLAVTTATSTSCGGTARKGVDMPPSSSRTSPSRPGPVAATLRSQQLRIDDADAPRLIRFGEAPAPWPTPQAPRGACPGNGTPTG